MASRLLKDRLLLVIVGATALVAVLLVAAVLTRGGEGRLVLPWFVPTVDSFLVLVAASITVLAFGRHRVQHDPTSLWMAAGFSGFGVSAVFQVLTFPGLLPDGGSFLPATNSSPAWAIFMAAHVLAIALLLSSVARWPTGGRHLPSWLVLTAWLSAITCLHVVATFMGPELPQLVRADGSLTPLALGWNVTTALIAGAGVALSTRRYLRTGDALSGYIALCQLVVLYFGITAVLGTSARFDLWWYLLFGGWCVGFVVVLFGQLSGYVHLFTQERQRATQLLESEERFRTLFEQSPLSLQLHAPDGRMLMVNQSWLRMWQVPEGQTARATEGYNVLEDPLLASKGILPTFREGFRGTPGKTAPILYDPGEAGRPARPRWVESYVTPIKDGHGRVREVLIIHEDITDRREAEEALRKSEAEFRAYADAMPQMAFIADAAGNITFYNRQHYQYFGASPGEHEGWRWQQAAVIHPDELEKVTAAWTTSVATGVPYEIEYRLRRHDGSYRWHLGRAVPFRDPQGRILRWFGTNTDIHDQKETARALEDAVLARDNFISIASHELKTPVTSMQMHVQLMERKLSRAGAAAIDEATVGKLLDVSSKQLHRLTRLIEDMLDISRIASGAIRLEREPMDLADLAREVVERFSAQLSAAQMPVRLHLEPGVVGTWDRFRIDQVVSNLVSNALKYASGQPVDLTVRRHGRGTAELSVRDHGPGIATDAQDRIFQRFERASSYTHTSGLGLGLYIAGHMLHLHGGSIRVESTPGSGSTFTIELPLDAPAPRRLSPASPAPPAP